MLWGYNYNKAKAGKGEPMETGTVWIIAGVTVFVIAFSALMCWLTGDDSTGPG